MTRIKLELTAVDDWEAIKHFHQIFDMMAESFINKRTLAPGYSTSDLDGSCVATVTREDNGIERGMDVTP